MFETVINLKPENEWRAGMTVDKLIAEMDKALQFPGVSNAWTMPIKARIDMLSTGIRTPVGVKVFGTDLAEMEKLARQIEAVHPHRAGHDQRLCRARDRRLLPQHRSRPRAARALRPHGRRRAERDRHGARRRTGHDHRRGPRALYRQHPLSARLPQRSAGDRDRSADPDPRWRHGAARPGREGQPRAGAGQHPHRECPARGLHLRRSARPRPRRLRRRRAEGGGGAGQVPARLLRHLERPVRISGARRGAAARSSCRSRC